MPPLTSSLLSRSTTGSGSSSSTRISAAAAAAISKPAAGAAPSSSPPPARPSPTPRPKPASPFASGLSGRLFGGHRAAARSSSSAAAVFERRFASAATRNSYDEILTSLAKPGGGTEFGKYYSLPALSDPRIDRLPYSIRILLESAIRNCDEFQVTGKDVEKIIDWENSAPKQVEIPFKPARILQELSDKAYSMGAASGLIRCRYSV